MIRRVRLRSLAKVNLDLRILHKRSDGFHELRTVFQTISLADNIAIEFEPARRTQLTLDANIDIADNLILRAARGVLDAAGVRARIHFSLGKRIPMGGGLGGGSSNAAAILLALPVLAGRFLSLEELSRIGAELGSDVPFFLTGGTALAVGTGTELYPILDLAEENLLVVSTGLHVATGPAYSALNRGLTFIKSSSSINSFQTCVRALGEERSAGLASALSENDFETVVLRQYPKLKTILGRLREFGAAGVRMTGSGSAIFAIYRTKAELERARTKLDGERAFRDCRLIPARMVSRRSYERLWRRQLREHLAPHNGLWPPRSRYER